jgi:hypothetical protein
VAEHICDAVYLGPYFPFGRKIVRTLLYLILAP